MTEQAKPKPNTKGALAELQRDVENVLTPLGYEVIALERSTGGGNRVTLFIDFLNNNDESRRVSLDDCVTVNRAVDDLFENTPLLEGRYTLEVSSPGVERPLRKAEDFERFSGRKARISTFRPLEKDESANETYWKKNKRQKNFVGSLAGITREELPKVKLTVDGQSILIPFSLISKAHLEFEERQGVSKK